MILLGVAVIVIGVVLSTFAGFGRDLALQKGAAVEETSGGFLAGLIMAVVAGVLSTGLMLGFVYTYQPTFNAVIARGGGELPAIVAAWAVGLLGGAAVNLAYPAWQMTKNRSWRGLFASVGDAALAVVLGLQFIVAITLLLGKGMLMLGIAGVGFGIQQALQLLGNQAVGFLSGEWRGVRGRPLRLMVAAVSVLVAAVCVLALGKALTP